jgi:hypothetical protein
VISEAFLPGTEPWRRREGEDEGDGDGTVLSGDDFADPGGTSLEPPSPDGLGDLPPPVAARRAPPEPAPSTDSGLY